MNQVVGDFNKRAKDGAVMLFTHESVRSLQQFIPFQGETVLLYDDDKEVEAVLERRWSPKGKHYIWVAKFDEADIRYITPEETPRPDDSSTFLVPTDRYETASD